MRYSTTQGGNGQKLELNANERICTLCTSDEIEDELHLLLKCSLYDDLRQTVRAKVVKTNDTFLHLSDIRKFVYMIEKHYVYVAKFIVNAMNRRESCFYNQCHILRLCNHRSG